MIFDWAGAADFLSAAVWAVAALEDSTDIPRVALLAVSPVAAALEAGVGAEAVRIEFWADVGDELLLWTRLLAANAAGGTLAGCATPADGTGCTGAVSPVAELAAGRGSAAALSGVVAPALASLDFGSAARFALKPLSLPPDCRGVGMLVAIGTATCVGAREGSFRTLGRKFAASDAARGPG